MARTTAEAVLQALQAYDLKQHGDEWRCNSPLRPGSNSHGFTLTIHPGGETGAWKDHVDGRGGSLYELADLLKIERPSKTERPKPDESLRVYRDLAEYAALKGVPVEAFTKAGWTEPKKHNSGRLAFNFPTSNGTRYRFTDGNTPKFSSETGFKACWYGLKVAASLAKELKAPLVLFNGEPSVVVGLHYKVPAFTLCGGETTSISDAMLTELKTIWQGEIVIALDCDEAGRAGAEKRHKQLSDAGFKVKAIDLGLGDKGDGADFCKLHTEDTLKTLLAVCKPLSMDEQPVNQADLTKTLQQLNYTLRTSNADMLPTVLDQIQSNIKSLLKSQEQQTVKTFTGLADIVHKRLDVRRANPGAVQGLKSGIVKLDEMIGGFVPGRVHCFYGDTGMGKSTMVASIATEFAAQGNGLVIPTESRPEDYLNKLAAFKAKVPFDCIETGIVTAEQYRALMSAYGWLESLNCDFHDHIAPTPDNIRTALQQSGKQYSWVLIDSINNLDSYARSDIYSKTSEAADLAIELARMGMVVLMTSQIGRNLKDRGKNKMPQLNDALGSGKIEQNSDVVLALYNHQYYVDREELQPDPRFTPGKLFVRCLKHRWRGAAVNQAAHLTFTGGVGVFD